MIPVKIAELLVLRCSQIDASIFSGIVFFNYSFGDIKLLRELKIFGREKLLLDLPRKAIKRILFAYTGHV
jgi:hypothetical protein